MATDAGNSSVTTAVSEKSDGHTPEEHNNEKKSGDLERDVEDPQEAAPAGAEPDADKVATVKLIFIAIGLWLAVFLVSLDQTIVANAIPTIADEFKSLSDVGWYGSGYLLTTSSFQLFYGRVYSNFSIKYVFLAAIAIFELGSLICGVAPTSIALIVGRAVAGLGGAGIMSGAMTIIAYSIPLRIRPMFMGSMGAVFAVSSVLGPVLGGIFTTHLTWRWCFYINLPVGGVTIVAILLLLNPPKRPELDSITLKEKLKKIDFIGLLIFIPTVVCLLLALQWGGSTYPWSDGRIIALFVLSGVLGISFFAFEYWRGDDATLPLRLLTKRSVAAATWNCFFNGGQFLILIYYIPFWHQVIRGDSPVDSGIQLLPVILGVVIMSIISGALVSKIGYYAPMMILGSIIAPIGEGLLTTWKVDTPLSKLIGYQAMAGIGIGLGQQQPLVAVQTVLSKAEVASGMAIVLLVQTLSGAIFVSVGQSVLQNELFKNLKAAFPSGDFDPYSLTKVGATQVASLVPPQYLPTVLVAYNAALTKVYTVAVCLSALTIIGSLTMEWRSVKKAKADN
ncbi:MFS general substrate transporter [Thozetella sp. PMI_491]|nr:MFS general substrate transporter [Thozetella sp. PMI_491]